MNNNQEMNPNALGDVPNTSYAPLQNQRPQVVNQVNNNPVMNNNVNMPNNQMPSGPVNPNANNFFNPTTQNNNSVNLNTGSYNDTSINDLNVDGTYNKINVAPQYVNEQQVRENIEAPKKNTVPVSKELKTVIIIAIILLIFIIIMPSLFDLISNLKFR